MRRLLAILMSSLMFLTSMPFAMNAETFMEGENLNPSECISKPVSMIEASREVRMEKDKEAIEEAMGTGYIEVPADPNEPLKALTEEEVEAMSDPRANDNDTAIMDNVLFNGKEYFAFLSFKATKGNTSKRPHLTSMKLLQGNRDTNKYVYCLNIEKDNPTNGTELQLGGKESEELLFLIRLGFPRGHTDRVPQDVQNCFYNINSENASFYNYYITQLCVWAASGGTTMENIRDGDVINGAPSDLKSKAVAFKAAAERYGPDWVIPKIWVSHQRKEATTDEKDPSQLCTPNYEPDLDGMAEPENVLKLMEKNVYTDLGIEVPPAMEMTIDNPPPGLRVLVLDKKTGTNRVYHIDNGDVPKLWAQDQYRFIIPNPTSSGEFTYTISGVYWTWRAYRYTAGGNTQDMLKEDVVKFGENLTTEGEVFWEKPDVPVDENHVYIKKVDKATGQPLPGAEIGIYKEEDDSKIYEFTSSNSAEDITDKVTIGESYYAKEISAPSGYTLDTAKYPFTPRDGETVNVVIENTKETPPEPDLYTIKAKKVDKETGEVLQGAKFQITGPGGFTDEQTTGSDGIATFTRLDPGQYTVTETEAPEGYVLPPNASQTVTLPGQDGQTVTVEFKDDKKVPDSFQLKAIKKDARDDKELAGAEFTLTLPDGTTQKGTSGADGVVVFDNLTQTGKYVITETKAPNGYELATNPSQEVTVDDPKNPPTTEFVFKNQPIEESFELKAIKKDATDGKELAGAEFTLTLPDGSTQTVISNEQGVALFDKLTQTGKYVITETKAPDGYQLAENPSQEVTVDDPKNIPTTEFVFENQPIEETFELKAIKKDAVTGGFLAGAEFTLTLPDGTTKTGTSNEQGVVVFDKLTQTGKYVIEETKAPNGYKLAENPKQEIEVTDIKNIPTTEFTFENQPILGSVELVKTDAVTGKTLEGVKFGLYSEADNKEIGQYTTDKNGVIKVDNLSPGKYYFKELEGLDGYVLDQSKVSFEIPGTGEVIKLTKTNTPETPKEGSVEITKTDVSTGEVLPGATITIYESDGKTKIAEGVTDKNGKFTFGPLKPGKYFFQETGAPNGYVLDDTLFPFEIKDDGSITKCKMTNKPVEGTLEITKVDISDGKLLPDAKFMIYDENKNVVVKGTTDENGIARFQLKHGKYYYQEYDAPVGYQLDDTLFPFEIKENGDIIKCRMTNVPTPQAPLPKTGATIVAGGSGIATLVGILSILLKRWF